jgi:gas vesicle protein
VVLRISIGEIKMGQHDTGVEIGAFFAGVLIGGLVGAAAALLVAPQSGEETRKQLTKTSEDLRDRAQDVVEDARERAEATIADSRRRAERIIEDARVKAEAMTEEARLRLEKANEDAANVAKKPATSGE